MRSLVAVDYTLMLCSRLMPIRCTTFFSLFDRGAEPYLSGTIHTVSYPDENT